MSLKVIILAGGRGTRLSCPDRGVPKPLIKVGKKTILGHQIDWLDSFGFGDIRLSLGFQAEKIMNFLGKSRKPYECVVEAESLGTGGAIKFASSDLKEPFLLVSGDILTDLNLQKFEESFRKTSAENMIASFKCDEPRDFGLLEIKGDKITNFLEKPEEINKGKDYYINTGIYILSPKTFKKFPTDKFSIEENIFPSLAERGQLASFVHQGFWMDAGTEERLQKAREVFA